MSALKVHVGMQLELAHYRRKESERQVAFWTQHCHLYYSHSARCVVIVFPMVESRPRSAAVTAAATLAMLGCASAFYFWGSFVLGMVNSPVDEHGQHFYQVHWGFFLIVALLPSALIAVGMRIGVGLFQLRPWARVAAMIWAAISLLLCVSIIAFRPFETFFIGDRFVGPLESLKQLIAFALVILMLPVSVWWLFLFRMKSVKAQFMARETSGTD